MEYKSKYTELLNKANKLVFNLEYGSGVVVKGVTIENDKVFITAEFSYEFFREMANRELTCKKSPLLSQIHFEDAENNVVYETDKPR